ncbi:HAMP domain-containing protein [Sphingomonas sp. MA1305]|uniref:sensor histidine kinase n=1 Tax=Sphingomonas sp. MA1305 TaxID=2479204 RepID=UPI0018DEF1FE|nr:ATP-binding protein [Sphingomonas sp. MA1305]MBI0474367.1 HAMP domain-containing protein [Sphingomonas sp. MA1305]
MSRSAEPAERVRSIAAPIFALVIAAVLVATAVSFVVTFRGPPPRDPPHALDDIAHALRTGAAPEGPGPHMAVTQSAAAPQPGRGQRADGRAAQRIAADLGVPASAVRAYAGPPSGPGGMFVDDFTFAVRHGDGWRIAAVPRAPLLKHWHWISLSAMLLAILILAWPAWALARAISRPLGQLAAAADAARVGEALPPLPTRGSREVRELAASVATMHARLAGHAEGRTAMLGAIAHDLGTPLSRLSFWVEQLPEAARTRASADIDEMRAMIRGALAFARDETGPRESVRVDLGSLLDSLADDMQVAGAPVTLTPGERAVVRGDPVALRRLFANLIDNAVRYGEAATIGWRIDGARVAVTVEDRGPGIDPAQVERLFEPFVRGDPSRNRATGGTGLGLAIVRTIAARHGGTAVLANGASGARATVTLPLAG